MSDFLARYEATRSQIAVARRAVRDYARDSGFLGPVLADIELCVGEALNNALEHGSKGSGHLAVSCTFEHRRLTVIVEDDGSGFAPELSGHPLFGGDLAMRGFGLYIMRQLMDSVSYSNSGRRVTLVKYL